MRRLLLLPVLLLAAAAALPVPAQATPVCTDGYEGGPPLSACGGRIFPEADRAAGYVQYSDDPAGFNEYRHGIEYLAQKYGRWVSVSTLSDRYGDLAKSPGPDGIRAGAAGDTGDGRDIRVIKLTDHSVPDAGKSTLFFSLSVHGNERGGLEGGLRTAEDLAMAATDGGKIADGVENYESATGRAPAFHEYEARDVLARQVVYLVAFNSDGWAVGDFWNPPLPSLYERGNSIGTDLNRQMPTVGRIDSERNPLEENEMRYGDKLMREIAAQGRNGRMDYGADVHGELTSQAYMDIMYPAGQFDSVDHRRLMAIAERTKSVIDATLYGGIIDEAEAADGGNEQEGSSMNTIPTKPAHWATVWDTLGYTDTGFIGDYLATEVGVTGMDYEIFLNHTVPDKAWNVYLQENHINATRGIIKTAMAYALFQTEEFNERNVVVDPKGRAGFVANPDVITDTDANGPGGLPGPGADGVGDNGQPVPQAHYSATNTRWFRDTSRLMPKPFAELASADIAGNPQALASVDSLVLADVTLPRDPANRPVDRGTYFGALKAWVERGGNLVLTDRGLHALSDLGLFERGQVKDIRVYQPHADFAEGDLTHPLVEGLRPNARQMVEAAILGYEIGDTASPMTGVDTTAWKAAKGVTVAETTRSDSDGGDTAPVTTVGELALGAGKIRIVGGALPTPTEENDHRYGLRDYGLTYSGLYVMENAIEHDVPGLGEVEPPGAPKPRASCTKRKKLTVKLPKGSKRKLRVTVNGKRAKVRMRKGRPVVQLKLKQYRGKRVTIVAKRRGKVVQKRRFRVC
jgi:hypothetical protein